MMLIRMLLKNDKKKLDIFVVSEHLFFYMFHTEV